MLLDLLLEGLNLSYVCTYRGDVIVGFFDVDVAGFASRRIELII